MTTWSLVTVVTDGEPFLAARMGDGDAKDEQRAGRRCDHRDADSMTGNGPLKTVNLLHRQRLPLTLLTASTVGDVGREQRTDFRRTR